MIDPESAAFVGANGPDGLSSEPGHPAEARLRDESFGAAMDAPVRAATAPEQPIPSAVAPADLAEATAPRSARVNHSLTKLFPEMVECQRAALVTDIKENGLREPIVLRDDEILDGRARYSACLEANVTPRFETFVGDDPLSYLVSMNLHRRHLSSSQRAMVAAKCATMRQGARTDLAQTCARSQSKAADLLGVGRRTVQLAHTVYTNGHPELVRRVEGGGIQVFRAAGIARMPMEQQAALVGLEPHALRNALKEAKRVKITSPAVVAAPEGVHKFYDGKPIVADEQMSATRDGGQAGTDGRTDSKEVMACLHGPFGAVAGVTRELAALNIAIEELGANNIDPSRCNEIYSLCANLQRLLSEARDLLGTRAAALNDGPVRARGAAPADLHVSRPRQSDAAYSSSTRPDATGDGLPDPFPGHESARHDTGERPFRQNAETIEPAQPLNRTQKLGVWDGKSVLMKRHNQILACLGPKGLGSNFERLGNMPARGTLLDSIESAPATPPRTAATTRTSRHISMEHCLHEAGHAMAHWSVGIPFISVTPTEVSGFAMPPSREEAHASEAADDVVAVARARTCTEMLMLCSYAGPWAQARCRDRRASPRRGTTSVARRTRVDLILALDGGQWDLAFVAECVADWGREGVAMAARARLLAEAFVASAPVWRAIREIACRLHAGTALSFEDVDQIARQCLSVDAAPTLDEWIPHWPPSAESVRRGYMPFHMREPVTDGLALFDAMRGASELQSTTDGTPQTPQVVLDVLSEI